MAPTPIAPTPAWTPQPAEPPARPPVASPPARRPGATDPGQPAARLPTAEQASRPKPVAAVEGRQAQAGDRICGNCSEPNDPVRKFCRRCGMSLSEARIVEAKRLPWWRRLFHREPKAPKAYAAGDRIASMKAGSDAHQGVGIVGRLKGLLGGIGIIKGVLALVVMLGVFGYVGIPSVKGMIDGVISGGVPGLIDKVKRIVAPTLEPVRPDSVTASNEVPKHTASMAFDTFTNTDWEANDATPTLMVTFKQPVDLAAVILHVGSADAFTTTRRPAELDLTFSDGTTAVLKPKDLHDPQTLDLSASGVTWVQIKVVAMNGPAGAPVSISEIELFKKG